MRRLIDVKRDIVRTIRRAIDIVSKYAGAALPEPELEVSLKLYLNGGRLKRVGQGLELSVLLVLIVSEIQR